MDNCSHNGDKLSAAVAAYAKAWTDNGKAARGFLEYIENPACVSFPWSMIDKITPRPDDSVRKMLEDAGFTDTESIVTSKNTYVAPFVNAEEAEYLVIEDAFPNGRPGLEKTGVMFTTRDTAVSYTHLLDVGDFLTFADYFFDGIIADWMVQTRIKDAEAQVEEAKQRVTRIRSRLYELRAELPPEKGGNA